MAIAVHDLGGGASVEVAAVRAVFASRSPQQEVLDGDKTLTFTKPKDSTATADIGFAIQAKNIAPRTIKFGIKQFTSVDAYTFSYLGVKPQDGSIVQSFRPPSSTLLDVSTTRLDFLFDNNNIPTGATAVAAHAPFYSALPIQVQNGRLEVLAIVDSPGGNFPLELHNAATDRRLYLDTINIQQTFLTVLVAERADGSHVPLSGQKWQNRVQGKVVWTVAPVAVPNVAGVIHVNSGLNVIPRVESDTSMSLTVIKDSALNAGDSIIQHFHNALFQVRHAYRAQNFNKGAANKEIRFMSNGYELIQKTGL